MLNILKIILITAILTIGIQNYVPLSWIDFLQPAQKFGTTVTTIASTDTISGSRTTINDNFTALNNGKIEVSTTTLPLLATLANLSTVGTITTGVWSGTALTWAKGGNASTTLSVNQILLGNTTSGFKVVSGYGTLGQFLTSGGSGSAPTWTTSSIDQVATYHWTANHIFDSANFLYASTTFASTTQLTISGILNAVTINASGAVTSNSHSLPEILLQDNTAYTTTSSATTSVYTYTLLANTMGIDSTLDISAYAIKNGSDVAVVAWEILFGNGSATTSLMSSADNIGTLSTPVIFEKLRILNTHSSTNQMCVSYKDQIRLGTFNMVNSTLTTYDTATRLFISFEAKTANAGDATGFKGITILKY